MSDALSRIEAIMADIERIDRESCGRFRQAEDREAFDIAARIERRMAQKFERDCVADGVSRGTEERKDASLG